MLEHAKQKTADLQQRMRDEEIELAVFTDESSIAYLAGFWGYLGIEFGRPTLLIVRQNDAPTVITPLMESEMVAAMTWVEDIRVWEDARSAKLDARSFGGSGQKPWRNLDRTEFCSCYCPQLSRRHLSRCRP